MFPTRVVRPHDYSKWDGIAQSLDEEADAEDPMAWPVCQEIPWHTVGPLVDRVLDEHFGPEKAEQRPSGPSLENKVQVPVSPSTEPAGTDRNLLEQLRFLKHLKLLPLPQYAVCH
ncbi:unnamed protein product [Symbiodinium natans]|uniref:Uncharacterized protein n=1 Tax=Symbiodinium natans TaxID=878477 RepID=A0A812U9U9_9DINO|nr:unnamed protein product [Symbiodinium natans]